jgi:hypothetical protein
MMTIDVGFATSNFMDSLVVVAKPRTPRISVMELFARSNHALRKGQLQS